LRWRSLGTALSERNQCVVGFPSPMSYWLPLAGRSRLGHRVSYYDKLYNKFSHSPGAQNRCETPVGPTLILSGLDQRFDPCSRAGSDWSMVVTGRQSAYRWRLKRRYPLGDIDVTDE
jgi:hypothetical protein